LTYAIDTDGSVGVSAAALAFTPVVAAARCVLPPGAGAATDSEAYGGATAVRGVFSTTVAGDEFDNQRNVDTGNTAIIKSATQAVT
jgi:hypothetical protein